MAIRIISLTTEYDENEDRIKLSAAYAGGATRVLWMTRRLAERLVPALLRDLAAPAVTDESPPREAREPQEAQAAQVYAQLEARLSHKPARPVQVDPGEPPALVSKITVKSARGGLRLLELECEAIEPAELVMRPGELRQWLEMLHIGFQRGKWRDDLWPDWMRRKVNRA